MSRSNNGKPFYVDVGTSIVAVRCASNHDVLVQYDYGWHPSTLELAKEVCDRMNREVEIGKPLRNCDVGSLDEQITRFNVFCENHMCNIGLDRCPLADSRSCRLAWSQMPYKKGDE